MNITLITRTTRKATGEVVFGTVTYSPTEYAGYVETWHPGRVDRLLAGKPDIEEENAHIKKEVVNATALALEALASNPARSRIYFDE